MKVSKFMVKTLNIMKKFQNNLKIRTVNNLQTLLKLKIIMHGKTNMTYDNTNVL